MENDSVLGKVGSATSVEGDKISQEKDFDPELLRTFDHRHFASAVTRPNQTFNTTLGLYQLTVLATRILLVACDMMTWNHE